ncbi:MAG: hypothetical protein WAS49_07545 [Candidatus Dechloromonas phosphoritropha]|jgi:hypothetical protein
MKQILYSPFHCATVTAGTKKFPESAAFSVAYAAPRQLNLLTL